MSAASAAPLAGKVGIVTGAGQGVGRAVVLELARQGAAVVVNDLGTALDGGGRDAAKAAEVVEAIVAGGGRAIANAGSVADAADAEAMVAAAEMAFDRVDFGVHCAGILRDRIFHKLEAADFDAVIAVHLQGGFLLSSALAKRFRVQGGGALVHMTSTSGLIGNVGQANYAAAKLGLVALTRSIALDMARFGVRANAIAPFAWTRMTASIPSAGASDDRVEGLRRARAEDVAALAAYLVSDAAAGVNGQVFSVRGREISVFSMPLPKARVVVADGDERAVGAAVAALAPSFAALQVSADVFADAPPD